MGFPAALAIRWSAPDRCGSRPLLCRDGDSGSELPLATTSWWHGAANSMTSDGWWALLAPAPLREPSGYITTPHDATRKLARAYDLGQVRIIPGDRQHVDFVASLVQGWSQLVSWPVLVTGQLDKSWPATDRQAARWLHRLCCMLSVAWGEPWQVRLAPTQSASYPAGVPDPILVPRRYVYDGGGQIGLREEVDLPGWFVGAWHWLEGAGAGKTAQAALSMWHEGILLQAEHPSMAFVAYTAALEHTAPLLRPDQLSVSARRQFWSAVSAVASHDELERLAAADAYAKRSATTHGGALHGIELEFGFMLLEPIGQEDPTYRFMFDNLLLLSQVSRRALIRVLQCSSEPAA